jgi:hypothetical protein
MSNDGLIVNMTLTTTPATIKRLWLNGDVECRAITMENFDF